MKNFFYKTCKRLSYLFLRFSEKEDKLSNLQKAPRYQAGQYIYQQKTLKFPDAASFVSIFKELFENEIYKFTTNSIKPYIIDCGANIGLSVVYFKSIYPDAEVIAFEPDKDIFLYLRNNTLQFDYEDLKLLNLGLWSYNGMLKFKNEGADSGRISFEHDTTNFKSTQQIEVVKLSKYIDKPVSFLKIDIEGSELEVLQEIEEKLSFVKRMFIEFHSFENSSQTLDVILNILTRNKFRYYLDSPSRFTQRPFLDKTTVNSFEFLVNIYAIKCNN